MKVELHPFQTPNYVTQVMPPRPRQEGWHEAPKFALKDVDADTLAALCDAFRAEVFRKAEKTDPQKGQP